MSDKKKFAFYLPPELREQIGRWQTADNSTSLTGFIENAVRFYLNYLMAQEDNPILPKAVSAAIEGRLGVFEDRMAKLLFKQTVELSMTMNLLAASVDVDDGTLRKLRGKCITDVKQTNGAISFDDTLHYQHSV